MINVKSICNSIKNMTQAVSQNAFPAIPAIIMLCSLAKRPGLSAIMSTINVVQAMKNKGIPTEPNPDGTPNVTTQLIYEIFKECYRAQREDGVMQGAVAPGGINVTVTGGNAGGPVTCVGGNLLPVSSIGCFA